MRMTMSRNACIRRDRPRASVAGAGHHPFVHRVRAARDHNCGLRRRATVEPRFATPFLPILHRGRFKVPR
jgi:hypothetical protein